MAFVQTGYVLSFLFHLLLLCFPKRAGPGRVEDIQESNLTTNPVCIQWQQPYMCYNGMNSFLYHVSVEGINLNGTSAVTTNETEYCFSIDPCASYLVTVIPVVQLCNGTTNSVTVNGLGGTFNTVFMFYFMCKTLNYISTVVIIVIN